MIIGKSQKEIEKMRASGQLVGQVLQALRAMVEPGLTTIEVDAAAEKLEAGEITKKDMYLAMGITPVTLDSWLLIRKLERVEQYKRNEEAGHPQS